HEVRLFPKRINQTPSPRPSPARSGRGRTAVVFPFSPSGRRWPRSGRMRGVYWGVGSRTDPPHPAHSVRHPLPPEALLDSHICTEPVPRVFPSPQRGRGWRRRRRVRGVYAAGEAGIDPPHPPAIAGTFSRWGRRGKRQPPQRYVNTIALLAEEGALLAGAGAPNAGEGRTAGSRDSHGRG